MKYNVTVLKNNSAATVWGQPNDASDIKCGKLTRTLAEAQFQSTSNNRIENIASPKQAKGRSRGTIADNLLARLASLAFSFPSQTSTLGEV